MGDKSNINEWYYYYQMWVKEEYQIYKEILQR